MNNQIDFDSRLVEADDSRLLEQEINFLRLKYISSLSSFCEKLVSMQGVTTDSFKKESIEQIYLKTTKEMEHLLKLSKESGVWPGLRLIK